MSAVAPIGIANPKTIELLQDDPVERANSVVSAEKRPEIRERTWGLNARTDNTVSWQEYIHWAKIERELEEEENKLFQQKHGKRSFLGMIQSVYKKNDAQAATQYDEKHSDETAYDPQRVMDAEWRTAARALRTAGWGQIFYLVTTDILGWSSAPSVFAAVGFGPGVALFIIFGAAAAYAAFGIWRTFLALDSSRFPMLSFGDPFLRIFGPWSRHFINVAQSIQMFLSVAVVILGNSVLFDQVAKQKICYVVEILIVMLVGVVSGMLRKLQHLGWICHLSVWMNVVNFIIIMYASANNAIDYDAVQASTLIKETGPVVTFAGPPPNQYQQQVPGFASQFNAVNNMVYAYSGALLFVAFMAEMRHPWDFWKGCFAAQAFICFAYILFGAFVYGEWGQYAIFNINTVVQPYSLQTAGNVLSLLTGWFAVFLYFNVGMKTVYLEVFQEILHFPPIYTKRGTLCWYVLGPIYWVLAFIVAAAVPNLGGLVSFIGGLFSLNFTYSIPAICYLGYRVKFDAHLEGEGFDPTTGETTVHDSGAKRYIRGFMKGWTVNIPTAIYICLGLACSGMGTWAAIEGLISIFGPGGTTATNFGCGHPT